MTAPAAGLARPVFCLVTDRTRLRPAGDAALVRLAAHAAAAGINLVQIREPDLDDRQLLALTRAIVGAVAGTGARVVVNDRVDIAMAGGADGVHLRADSAPVDRVRAMVPDGFLIGRSVHSATEVIAAAAGGADYLILGTVFPSSSKPAGTRWLGLEGLVAAVRGVRTPVLAIGGVTADKAGSIAAAGAAGFAAIGLFAELQRDAADDALDTAFRRLVAGLRADFDPPVTP